MIYYTLRNIIYYFNYTHLDVQTKYVPKNINDKPIKVDYFNFFFFKYDSVIIVTAEFTQLTITGPKLKGV